MALSAGCAVAAADDGSRDSVAKVDSADSGPASGPSRGGRSLVEGRRAAPILRSRAVTTGRVGSGQTAAATAAPHADTPRSVAHSGASLRATIAPSATPSATLDMTPQPANRANAVPAPAAAPSTNVGGPVSPAQTATELRPAKAAAPWPGLLAPRSRQLISATHPLATATVAGLALTNVLQSAVLMAVSVLTAAPPGPFTATPTLRLNGFDIVPASVEEVTSLYGRWAYMPGAPGLIQGRQQFGVVDPKTGDQVGTFDALVSRGNGIGYTELLVTSTAGPDGGAADGRVPPAGSLISNLQFGPIGISHSALPTPTGNALSLKITTPFGDIPVRFPFDNAKGIADHTVDNRPMRLGNGYSIAPTDPDGETLIGTSGIMPGFMTVQGHQDFSVYDPNGRPVGGFTGVFTTTADLFFYTQAVMVTANDGTNVGSAPGQVPPVGSVFNVIYFGTDDHFLLYSALPRQSGADVSVIKVNKGRVTTSALSLIDATAPPRTPLPAAGGVRFVPVSDLRVSGVNGLPPREVQIQGYQQFDIQDSSGARIGTVDADVFDQWDAFGIRSTALLITNVAEGGDGVPPVGSIFNFVGSRAGIGSVHSTVPSPSGNLTSFTLLTPLGDIPMPSTFVPVAHRTPVSFYSPFR